MSLRAYRTFQALILAASGLGMLTLVLDGHMLDYIHPRLILLTVMAALAMIILAQVVLRERPSENEMTVLEREDTSARSASGLWWTVLPLLVGLLVSEPQPAAGKVQPPDHSGLVRHAEVIAGFHTPIMGRILTADESPTAAKVSMPETESDWPQSVLLLNHHRPSGLSSFQTYEAGAFLLIRQRPKPFVPRAAPFYSYD